MIARDVGTVDLEPLALALMFRYEAEVVQGAFGELGVRDGQAEFIERGHQLAP